MAFDDINYGFSFFDGFEERFVKEGLPKGSALVDLPHPGRVMPSHYYHETAYQGLFSYEKTFDYEPNSHRLILELEGAMLKSQVYLNGSFVGSDITSFFPSSFDLTPYAIKGANRLLIVVDSREDPSVPPFGGSVDYLLFAGLYRPLRLYERGEAWIEDLFPFGDMEGNLSVEASIGGAKEGTKLEYRLSLGGKEILSFEGAETKVPDVSLWDLATPTLYDLEAVLYKNGQEIDRRKARVGFRNARFDAKEGFFLNEKPLKLRGLNRHQSYPYMGSALPASAQAFDASILKREAGVNIVRTSHYPQSEAFLSACDELGLLLIDEVPGWQYIGKDEAWRKNFLSFIERMVKKERNHPCLIAYGVRIDESGDDDELYEKANQIAHGLDPHRPTLGVRNFKTSHCLEDIYCYNDFSGGSVHHGLDPSSSIAGAKGKPVFVTEFEGHMFPTKAFDTPERRKELCLRHLKVLDDAYKDGRLAGVLGWCAFDYATHENFGSGDHICYHGVFDRFRNPKDAAYVYKSQDPEAEPFFWVSGTIITGDNDECLLKPLVVLTNCDYVSLYRGEEFVETFKPDKRHYPHLPHPPIIVDDFIGASFKEGYSASLSKRIRGFLNDLAARGVAHFGPKDYLRYGPSLIAAGLTSRAKISHLYYKYATLWGSSANVYQIKCFKDGREIGSKSFGPAKEKRLYVESSHESLLNARTYDVAVVRLSLVDEYGTVLPYADDVVKVSLKGPVALLGPSEFALTGGRSALFVRSLRTASPTEAEVDIKVGDLAKKVRFRVI